MPLIDRIVCVSAVSKDLRGELRLVESDVERCRARRCKTLETVHHLDLEVPRHDCDSDLGSLLDGKLHSGDLVHKFQDADGHRRGVHEGSFRWASAGALITGSLRGVTNAGTHRAPAFEECQRCESPGVMEGLLLGTVRRARDPRLRGCEVQAAYRLRFDPSEQGGAGGVAGTLEGAVVCDCGGGPERVCIELGALAAGPGPNPRSEQGVTFHVHDFAGTPVGNTHVRTLGAFTGLDVDRRVEIALPGPCSAVEATLVTFAAPATLEAINSDGSLAGSAKMTGSQQVAETLSVSGASIERAVITAPSGETLLLRWCFEPLAG